MAQHVESSDFSCYMKLQNIEESLKKKKFLLVFVGSFFLKNAFNRRDLDFQASTSCSSCRECISQSSMIMRK